MAFRRFRRGRRRVRRFRRRARRGARPRRALNANPKCKMARIRWVGERSLNPPNSPPHFVEKNFHANDIYTPDPSTITHQPMGFDNLANMFYHFVVVGSKMTITPIPQKAGESSTFIYGIKVSGATSLPAYTGLSNIIESGASYRVATPDVANYSRQRKTSKGFSAKKFYCNKNPLADSTLRGSFGDPHVPINPTSPTEQTHYIVWVWYTLW